MDNKEFEAIKESFRKSKITADELCAKGLPEIVFEVYVEENRSFQELRDFLVKLDFENLLRVYKKFSFLDVIKPYVYLKILEEAEKIKKLQNKNLRIIKYREMIEKLLKFNFKDETYWTLMIHGDVFRNLDEFPYSEDLPDFLKRIYLQAKQVKQIYQLYKLGLI